MQRKELVLGGVIHTRNDTFARLLYIACPAANLDHPHLPELIPENLSGHAGTWGAFHVLAEVGTNPAPPSSLSAGQGFPSHAWQRMWNVSEIGEGRFGGRLGPV